ncbi:MAG: hypothetical protein WCK98_00775 [bacterium]
MKKNLENLEGENRKRLTEKAGITNFEFLSKWLAKPDSVEVGFGVSAEFLKGNRVRLNLKEVRLNLESKFFLLTEKQIQDLAKNCITLMMSDITPARDSAEYRMLNMHFNDYGFDKLLEIIGVVNYRLLVNLWFTVSEDYKTMPMTEKIDHIKNWVWPNY